uniref:Uncharacterized protein n=1 Tax=Tanacetum cinerariifolium TaxID=118510 RepID=A0A699L4D4_TANCI|nr:hypothetical protein [Tanacetum cinerariifolium]
MSLTFADTHSMVAYLNKLQALVDKNKVVITKATIRDALRLDDAEGNDCLPNEEIFAALVWVMRSHQQSLHSIRLSSQASGRVIEEQGDTEEQVQDDVDDAAAQGADTAVQGDDVHELSIPSPTLPTPPPQPSQDLPSHHRRNILHHNHLSHNRNLYLKLNHKLLIF